MVLKSVPGDLLVSCVDGDGIRAFGSYPATWPVICGFMRGRMLCSEIIVEFWMKVLYVFPCIFGMFMDGDIDGVYV